MQRRAPEHVKTALRLHAKKTVTGSKYSGATLDDYFAKTVFIARRSVNTKTTSTTTPSTSSSSSYHKLTRQRGPRTKLPFLQNTVRHALTLPNTVNTTTPFLPYPILPPNANKPPNGSTVLYKDNECILVNDAYPKSFVHCLLMPLDLRLVSLASLNAQHVRLLQHFVLVANEYVSFLKSHDAHVYSSRRFITGFHALPSLPMLHMHLLTLDLDSPCIKTKKHYNSFATFFFLTSERVIDDLQKHGRITLNRDVDTYTKMENQDMKCLWCGTSLPTIPAVKSHLPICSQNKSLERELPQRED